MPWKVLSSMDQKLRFVTLARSGKFHISDLCIEFGISRKTGHKYIKRFADIGSAGLKEKSRRPHVSSNATDAQVEKLIIKERRLHRTWGPKKIRVVLRTKHGIESPPATSTIGSILKRLGLAKARRRGPGATYVERGELTVPSHPNEVWTVDFKGWFLLKNGQRCDPLTVCDLKSHYIIGCRAMPNQQYKRTHYEFKRLMRRQGLPEIIRVDNGTPFASVGLGGFSRLSVWWISQGISVEFTRPGCPQDNGSHERMHKDLKTEATKPPSANMKAQKRRFQRWVDEFNHQRPHEALGMMTPSDSYHSSRRRLNQCDIIRYPKGYDVVRVGDSGHIYYEGRNWRVGEAFIGQPIGLLRTDKGRVEAYYANVRLGHLAYGSDGGRFRPAAYIAPLRSKTLDINNPLKHKTK